MQDIIIGIDPDSNKDGVAILFTNNRRVAVYETTFGHTVGILQKWNNMCLSNQMSLMVVIEGGWLNKGNYHCKPTDRPQLAAAKGVDQGRNHQRGLDIVDFCEFNHIPHTIIRPLPKTSGRVHLWSGKDGKITQKEIESFMGPLRTTDKKGRACAINQEGRDAALIAWVYAGLPISVRK